jgi:hypothetical protein
LVALSLGPEVKDGAAVRVKEEPHREGR